MSAKIIIGADIVPTSSNISVFENGKIEKLVDNKLLKILESADYRIFNLEAPLVDSHQPIKKCGPNLIASTQCITGIKKLGVDFFTLANNHIMDQDALGLTSTIKVLDDAEIAHAGAGQDIEDASKPYIIDIDGLHVGIFCCAEHEFSIANEDTPGANPFDPLESLDHIAILKKNCDYVICLYHGGRELYPYASPSLQKTCRKIIEKGANLVVCQHSHCIGCKEEYLNGVIVYGQGNFLFDYSRDIGWQTSMLLQVTIENTYSVDIEYIPLRKAGPGVQLAKLQDGEEISKNFLFRSEQITDSQFVKENYKDYAVQSIEQVLKRIDGFTSLFWFRAINKLCANNLALWYFKHVTLKKKKYSLINTVECETWRELLLSGLKNV